MSLIIFYFGIVYATTITYTIGAISIYGMAVLVALVYYLCVMSGFVVFLVASWSYIRRYAAIVGVGLVLANPLVAQPTLGDGSVNPFTMGVTSPTAAGIGEAALSDIALETGAIQTNIPLFEITTRGGLSVPVTLSYQSNGVRLNDVESWVGLGWTLHAGGAVTRTVRGEPDETETSLDTHNQEVGGGYPLVRHRYDNMFSWSVLPPDIAREMSRYHLDTQPDLFTYSNPNHSGGFIWYDPITFVPVPYAAVDISGDPTSGWTLNDANGITYTYTAEEETNEVSSDITSRFYLSAWYLTSMADARGSITFTYSERSHPRAQLRYFTSFSDEEIATSGTEFCQGISTGSSPQGPINFQETRIEGRFLETIESEDMRAVFHSARGPTPMVTTPFDPPLQTITRLDSIHVYALPGNILIRSFYFDYAYHMSPYNGFLGLANNRLFLTSVTEVGHDGDALPFYRFTYIDPELLPGRLSPLRQNAWGFAGISGTSAASMSSGLLERIDYPTGGREQITYEPNRLPYAESPGPGLLRVPGGGDVSVLAEFPSGPGTQADSFYVDAGDGDWTRVYFEYELRHNGQLVENSVFGLDVRINCNDGEVDKMFQVSGTYDVKLDNGTGCEITANVSQTTGDTYMARLRAYWDRWIIPPPGTPVGEIVGGLRVRERRSYPDPNDAPLVRQYRYVDTNGDSSGTGREGAFRIELDPANYGCDGYIEAKSAVSTVGAAVDVTYNRVEVLDVGPTSSGKTAYTFYQQENIPVGGTGDVFIPGALTNFDWQNHPTGHVVYDATNEVLMRSTSGYAGTSPAHPHHTVANALTARIFPESDTQFYVAYYTLYQVISGWMRVVETEEIHYDTD